MYCSIGNVFNFAVCVNVFIIKHEGETRRKWWREKVSQIVAFRDRNPAGATLGSVCVRWYKASALPSVSPGPQSWPWAARGVGHVGGMPDMLPFPTRAQRS